MNIIDDRELNRTVELLRTEVVKNLKPLGSIGGWEIADRAAEFLEAQHGWIAELVDLVRSFDRIGIAPQPVADDHAAGTMLVACQIAERREKLRKTLEKARAVPVDLRKSV